MNWVDLKSQKDIDGLMNKFCGFHDSYITKIDYNTGMVVSEDKSMGNNPEKNNIKIVFQSQLVDTIEIYFQEVQKLNINTDINFFGDIFGATFKVDDNLICWADTPDWDGNNPNGEITYVVCKKVSYRNILKIEENVIAAHQFCGNHKKQLTKDNQCGCFCCLEIFNPNEIKDWIDDDKTALCPNCGVDSVIGESSGYPITKDFLEKMNQYWL